MVLLDENCAYITDWTGKLLKCVVLRNPSKFKRLIHCKTSNQFVSWKRGEEDIVLYSDEIHVVNETVTDLPVLSAIYNEYRNEIIFGHQGGTSTWQFRYNNQYLVQSRYAAFRSFPSEDFEFLSLEATRSKTQKGYAASGNVVVVYSLENGTVFEYKRNLHLSHLTAILYFNPLKLLITAASDGTIKAWNTDWTLRRVLVGHTGSINSLAFYPSGASFLSTGVDKTIRVWCLDTPGQLSSVTVDSIPLRCNTIRGENFFLSVCLSGGVDLWKANDLHALQTCGGNYYKKLICTPQTFWPSRAVAMCGDSCVRIIAVNDGSVITTALPPSYFDHSNNKSTRELSDIAYSIFDDTLFAIYDNGELAKFKTNTNPATLSYLKKPDFVFREYTAISVFEKIVNPFCSGKQKELATQSLKTVSRLDMKTSQKLNRCVLFAGRRDGCICIIDWHTGELQFEIEGHLSDGGVCAIVCNEQSDMIISSGHDQIIRIWKFYSMNTDPLSLMSSFFCAQLPNPLCPMSTKFSAALQHPQSATFSLVTYDFDVNGKDLIVLFIYLFNEV